MIFNIKDSISASIILHAISSQVQEQYNLVAAIYDLVCTQQASAK